MCSLIKLKNTNGPNLSSYSETTINKLIKKINMKCKTDINNAACVCNRFDLNRQDITEHEPYKYHLGNTFSNWNTAMVMNKTILLLVCMFTFHICDVI